MENARIRQLPAQMAALEDELRSAVHEQESRVLFRLKGKRIEFEQSIRQAHRKLKTGFFRWLVTNRPQNLITGPIIYGMIVPGACRSVRQLLSSNLFPDLPDRKGAARRLHRI